MSQSLKITILGCGGSAGVPAAGNYWGVCDPNEPKNNRTRCSIAVQSEDTSLIIDTGPDFRHQLNREDISQVDGVLYTHYHGDHVDGVADLRGFRFRNNALVSIYANRETLDVFERTIPHLLHEQQRVYPQILEPNEITPDQLGKVMSVGDISFVPFEQDHGTCKTIGYRFGDLAYSVDILELDDTALETLKGIKTWVVDSTGYHSDSNPVHINLARIYEYNQIIGAQHIVLSSLSLSMDYKTLCEETPDHVEPAYDGLVLSAKV